LVGDISAEYGFTELVAYYEFWRKVANAAGSGPYDKADQEDGRLFFRSDYSDKVRKWPEWAESGYWGAWIIASAARGHFAVLSSLLHERQNLRTESLCAIFSKIEDAGKYVIMRIGDSARVDLCLKSLFVKWDDRGLDANILVEPANHAVINLYDNESPALKKGFAEKHLKKYLLESDRGAFGFALPEEKPRMEVLTQSFEELTEALLDGMPENIGSQVAVWREQSNLPPNL
jgi:hypothetical protein